MGLQIAGRGMLDAERWALVAERLTLSAERWGLFTLTSYLFPLYYCLNPIASLCAYVPFLYSLLPIASFLFPLSYSLLAIASFLFPLCPFLYLPCSINKKCPIKGHYILEAEREGFEPPDL